MPKDNRNRKSQLALALAGGDTVAEWAEKNRVSVRTAYRWAGSTEVRSEVDALRAAAVEQALGRLIGGATAAAERIAYLAGSAASEAVQLQASRAVLKELVAVSTFSVLERRMIEIERRIELDKRARESAAEYQPPGPFRPETGDRRP